MARSTYTDETKAAVMAALLTGQSVSEVADEYDIPRGTVAGWSTRAQQSSSPGVANAKKEEIGDLLTTYLQKNLAALTAQAEAFADPEWLREQSAEKAAVLHGVMTDKAVRLLEAFGRARDADA